MWIDTQHAALVHKSLKLIGLLDRYITPEVYHICDDLDFAAAVAGIQSTHSGNEIYTPICTITEIYVDRNCVS